MQRGGPRPDAQGTFVPVLENHGPRPRVAEPVETRVRMAGDALIVFETVPGLDRGGAVLGEDPLPRLVGEIPDEGEALSAPSIPP